MATSNMPTGSRSPRSMDLFAVGCGRCCAGRSTDRVKADAYAITHNGRMPSSLILGCSRCTRPIDWHVNPDVETTDWRARRGRTAQRVRREGTAIAVSYPYPTRVPLKLDVGRLTPDGGTIWRMIDWSTCPAVERDPERVSGAWVFRGTRVPVAALFENLEDGALVSQFVEWFPGVTIEQARLVLEHAARSALAPA